MGYDIYIGEAVPVADEDGFRWIVEKIDRDDAPCFANDTMTGKGNHRHPGYCAWSEFTEIAGLKELFYDKYHGLLRDHSGIQPLTQEHRGLIDNALRDFNAAHPEAVPRFGEFAPRADNIYLLSDDMGQASLFDAALARLEWLAYWVGWAVDNCHHPAMYNF